MIKEGKKAAKQVSQRNMTESPLAIVNYNKLSKTPPKIIIEQADIHGQNIIHPEYEQVTVTLFDASQNQHMPTFKSTGISFHDYPTEVEHFHDDNFQEKYNKEIIDLVLSVCDAREAFVFDHTIRDDRSRTRSPAKHVHNDYTDGSAHTRLYDFLNKDEAQAWELDGFAIVNVWRPINNPVEQSPLCFIDTKSIAKSDWVKVDLIYPERQAQVMGVYHNTSHKWLYLPNMAPNEVVIFRVADSKGKSSVAHSAVDLIKAPKNANPRRSIETRVFIRF